MDTKTLIKSLRALFSNENKIEKKYTKVWMDWDSYPRGYRINIQYDNPFLSVKEDDEIAKLKELIHEKIEGSKEKAPHVKVYYFEDGYYHLRKKEILVYDDLSDPYLNYSHSETTGLVYI